jgi:hypothetical protein
MASDTSWAVGPSWLTVIGRPHGVMEFILIIMILAGTAKRQRGRQLVTIDKPRFPRKMAK